MGSWSYANDFVTFALLVYFYNYNICDHTLFSQTDSTGIFKLLLSEYYLSTTADYIIII